MTLRSLIALAVLVPGMLAPWERAAGQPVVLTVEDAVQRAQASSAALQAGRFAVTAAGAAVAEQRSARRPSLTFQSGISRGSEPSQLPVYAGDEIYFARVGSANSLQAQLNYSQPLYDFGRTALAVKAARRAVQAQQAANERTASQLASQTRAQFYRALAQARMDSLYGRLIGPGEVLAEISRRRVAAGAALEPDILRAQIDIQNARARQTAARADARRARDEVARLAGLQGQQVALVGELPPLPVITDPQALSASLYEQALRSRADLRALSVQSQQQVDLARVAEAATRPLLQLQSSATYYGPKELFGVDAPRVKTYNWRVGLSFTYPILDGQRSQARREQALALADQYTTQRQALEGQIVSEINATLDQYTALQATAQAAQMLLQSARANLDVLDTQRKKGVATEAAYTQALVAAIQAEAELMSTQISMRDTLAALEATVGSEIRFNVEMTP